MWEKSKGKREREREKERENNTVNRGHYVCHAASLQRRTGSARTSLGPKEKITVLMEAITYAMQTIYNAARAAHALRSDQ